MRKTIIIIALLLVLSSQAFAVTYMGGGYEDGRWVQYSDDTRIGQTYSAHFHTGYDNVRRYTGEQQLEDWLCQGWNVNGRCKYSIDPIGRLRFIANPTVTEGQVTL